MAQTQDGTSRTSTRKSRAKKKTTGEKLPADQTFITSAERKKRKGPSATESHEKEQPCKRPSRSHVEASQTESQSQAVELPQERGEGTATPSDSNSDAQREGAQRAPVQSPVGASAAGEKAKTVFSSIISPVLTLFQGKQEGKPEEPSVVLEDGQRAHVGPHRCDGGPEPSPGQHKGQPQQVEGMPMPMPMPSQQGQAGGPTHEPASSTSGESHTCVDNGGVPCDKENETEGVPADVEDECDEVCIDFDPYTFIKNLPPLKHVVPRWRRSLLPRQTRQCKRKTLVLDLDETLVHSTLDGCEEPDFSFPVAFNGREHQVHVRRRPHLDTFLQRCAALFEIVVFTASQKVYAEQLLNVLDPQRCLIRHRVFRDSCVLVEGNYLKDLSVLGRDLSQTVIVDNSPQAFGYQLPNGIPIESWYDDDEDRELLELLPFLESLVDAEDVRPAISATYKLKELVDSAPLYPSF
ncbi:g1449 [Coccomyxa viridis]|uniref:G1449 protein n=1 Tax=Coccomyxa viridis TaxID=1274662 RepID=A0ABP1FPU6_9CHLO